MKDLPISKFQQVTLQIKEGMTLQQQAYVYHKEGKNFLDIGDILVALECFNQAISLGPTPTFYVNRASCNKQLKKFSDAYFDYSFAIRLDPESGSLYCQRGLCLAKLNKLSLAFEDLNEACRVYKTFYS
jgi:tetratricopeptide (TPR) repeat protein